MIPHEHDHENGVLTAFLHERVGGPGRYTEAFLVESALAFYGESGRWPTKYLLPEGGTRELLSVVPTDRMYGTTAGGPESYGLWFQFAGHRVGIEESADVQPMTLRLM